MAAHNSAAPHFSLHDLEALIKVALYAKEWIAAHVVKGGSPFAEKESQCVFQHAAEVMGKRLGR